MLEERTRINGTTTISAEPARLQLVRFIIHAAYALDGARVARPRTAATID